MGWEVLLVRGTTPTPEEEGLLLGVRKLRRVSIQGLLIHNIYIDIHTTEQTLFKILYSEHSIQDAYFRAGDGGAPGSN